MNIPKRRRCTLSSVSASYLLEPAFAVFLLHKRIALLTYDFRKGTITKDGTKGTITEDDSDDAEVFNKDYDLDDSVDIQSALNNIVDKWESEIPPLYKK